MKKPATVYAGAAAPEAFRIVISAGASGLDMTTVTSVAFKVTKPNGESVMWDAAISSPTIGSLVATHTYNIGEVPTRCTLEVMPHLTVPGGALRCAPVQLRVK